MASTTAIQAAQDFVEEHYGPAIAERSDYTMDIADLLDNFAADAVRENLHEAREENEKLRQTLFDVVENGGMMRRVAEIEDDYVVVPHPETMKRVREALRSGGGEEGSNV